MFSARLFTVFKLLFAALCSYATETGLLVPEGFESSYLK